MTAKLMTRWAYLAVILVGGVASHVDTVAHAQASGRVVCRATENGEGAEGTITLRSGDREIASGSCGSPVTAAPGAYTAVVRLDGALGDVEQTRSVSVRAGATENVSVDFSTAVVEVRATSDGRAAAASARLSQGGREIGTLSSGVPAHVAVGTYDIVVRHRDREQRFDGVSLTRGERRVLSVTF